MPDDTKLFAGGLARVDTEGEDNQGHKSIIKLYDCTNGQSKLLQNDQIRRLDSNVAQCLRNFEIIDAFVREKLSMKPTRNGKIYVKIELETWRNYTLWDSAAQEVHFGDVDHRYQPLLVDITLAAHEIGHSIIRQISSISTHGQSYALLESWSDVYGIMVKHYYQHVNHEETLDWDIGKDRIILNPENEDPKKRQTCSMRSMSNPGSAYGDGGWLGKDPQPDRMSDYVEDPELEEIDRAHRNNGIPNKAFYLTAIAIKGITGESSWELPGQIWHRAIKNSSKNEKFRSFAQKTLTEAKNLMTENNYHLSETERVINSIRQAWKTVEVLKD